MLGQHPTPPAIVSSMLDMAKAREVMERGGRFLDPGCGEGAFLLEIIQRYARLVPKDAGAHWLVDRVRGVELDPEGVGACRKAVRKCLAGVGLRVTKAQLERMVVEGDFTEFSEADWDVVIGNPPYVRVEGIAEADRLRYRTKFKSALNRFDLYFIFFEQGLRLVKSGGVLCFITPQKFAQVWSGANLRDILRKQSIERIQILSEDAFDDLITYPAITLVRKQPPPATQKVAVENQRLGSIRNVPQSDLGKEPWFQLFQEDRSPSHRGLTLADVCTRIGVGVATGADSIFHVPPEVACRLPAAILRDSVGGRQLPNSDDGAIGEPSRMIFPYDEQGRLLPPSMLGTALDYLSLPHHKAHLERRSCARGGRRPWYAYHETPRPDELRKPKILTQDIQKEPRFFLERNGYVPRHSVYYIVPKPGVSIERLLAFLNSESTRKWIKENSQHAAGGHFRIQTQTLRRLPVPAELVSRFTLEQYA